MFLRTSPLAQANGALREFALDTVDASSDPLERLHLLMAAIHDTIVYDADERADFKAGAAEDFALRRAGAAGFAHIFIACARHLGVPARYVSGYLAPLEGPAPQGLFAWAEAAAPALGWVAFDAVHDQCADDRYVRVAVGFDLLGAAPFRVSQSGGGDETIDETVRIEQAAGQSQN